MKNKIDNKLDRQVFQAFGHSWACGDKISDCMCQGGTFWNEVAKPLVKQALADKKTETIEEIIKLFEKKATSFYAKTPQDLEDKLKTQQFKKGFNHAISEYHKALEELLK